jgi:hypothetical protein
MILASVEMSKKKDEIAACGTVAVALEYVHQFGSCMRLST